MTTQDDMKFFIDPLTDPFLKTGKVYVTEERVPRHIHVGKIVEVEDHYYRHGGRMWSITKGTQDHVAGHVVNFESLEYNSPVIGWREGQEDAWFVGRHLGSRNNRGLLGNVKRFDQRALPQVGATRQELYEHADVWFPAAEWAMELMPEPQDSPALVRTKLAIAEQRWTQRKAKITLMIESMARNYSQLDQLIDDGDMPLPKFGAMFVGSVLIPAGRAPGRDDRTVAVQEQIDNLQTHLGGNVPEPTAMLMSMRVETSLPVNATGRSGMESIKPGLVRDTLQSKLGNYELRVTDYQLTPILRGAVSGAATVSL